MSGSSVSNVITTGAMTIPLMTRIGYKPAVAGGIESASSVGGALMPPVMGAAAFVMAEITNIPYAQIVVAAAIGAVLYYFAILVAVHVEAKKAGMAPMAAADIPPWREVAQDAHLVIPIAILVWLMMDRWSGNYAAFCATIAMVAVAALSPPHPHGLAAGAGEPGECRPDHGAAGGLHRRRRHRRLGADRDGDGRGARRHHQGPRGAAACPCCWCCWR